MKVFVTGGTGYIGSAVVERLVEKGHSVTGLARSKASAQRLTELGAAIHDGDLAKTKSIEAGIGDADAVIHIAMSSRPDAGEIDSSAVSALVASLAGSGKTFLYTSGIWVLGHTGSVPADENRELDPTPLVAWRPAVEQQVLQAVHRGVRSVVIRPAIVFGRGGGITGSMARAGVEEGVVRYVGDGENEWPFVHVEDLADFYLKALSAQLSGVVLHAAEGPSVKSKAVAAALAAGLGIPGKTESWPVEAARSVLGPFADALTLSQRICSDKAKSLIGWKPSPRNVLEELRRQPLG